MNKITEKLNRLPESQQVAAFIIGVVDVALICGLLELGFKV